MTEEEISSAIEEASDDVIQNWPLYSFVTSNPLHGSENRHFEEAIRDSRSYLGCRGYPSAAAFKQAWQQGEIDASLVKQVLAEQDLELAPEESLESLAELEREISNDRLLGEVDQHLIKWLTVFLDQGSTEWGMPNRENGFYRAWQEMAAFDLRYPGRSEVSNLPGEASAAIQHLMESVGVEKEDLNGLIKHHFLALPGWTGYIKYRMDADNEWQNAYPITLLDYLAVRLSICSQLKESIWLDDDEVADTEKVDRADRLRSAWLRALEYSYQNRLIPDLIAEGEDQNGKHNIAPEAQLVFCIDTRSERIRRAVEQSGDYETFGYAGFFGIPMEYNHPEKDISHRSCPPIVDPQFIAREQMDTKRNPQAEKYQFYQHLRNALNEFRFTLKNNIPASFGYVESAGFFYGLSMLLKTVLPDFISKLGQWREKYVGDPETFSDISLHQKSDELPETTDLPADVKAEIAKSAFELMGWRDFAPLVVFAGHGSETANNPFGSSLDCGACAGNSGRHNARLLSNICNEQEVRKILSEEYGIDIPQNTWFLAAEHNTTTNEIRLFGVEAAPEQHADRIDRLRADLRKARDRANSEQIGIEEVDSKTRDAEVRRRSCDWSETRPEWGLAGNASFIIGSRSLTRDLNLQARSFLHRYDWKKDPEGESLTAILQGPMVVTQWINNHYYFAAVDNQCFGSGTKITQNPTGNFGVVQGNGGDLQNGLPLESLREDDQLLQHMPCRLSVFVHAPIERVESILQQHQDSLGQLVDNEWIYLAVVDPQDDHRITFLGEQARSVASLGNGQ